MKRPFFFLLLLFLWVQETMWCQCKAYVDVAEFTSLYDISSEKFKKKSGYHFPEFLRNDSIQTFAYNPFTRKKDDVLKWEKLFPNGLNINIDSTHLFLKCYTNNVDRYQIEFEMVDGEKITYGKKVNFNKYQLPIVANFAVHMLSNNYNDVIQSKNILIRKFVLTVFPNRTNQKCEFAIADFRVSSSTIHSKEFNHPFFGQIGNGYFPTGNSLISYDKNIQLFSTFSDYCWDENAHSTIHIKNEENKNTDYYIKNVFKQVFDKYPFYEEKNISKVNVLNRFEKIYDSDSIVESVLWDSLRNMVQAFNDPHFSIPVIRPTEKRENHKISPPIRIHEFYDRFYISAIFDTTLTAHIKPGMEIIGIDYISIQTLISEKIKKNDHNRSLKKIEIMNEFLQRNKNDSVNLSLTNGIDTFCVNIFYNNKPFIPDNFRPEHASFRFYDNEKIVFFRINNWTLDINTYLYNNIDKLKKSNGLILDLRNNGGGDNIAVTRFTSFFINEPKAFSHSQYSWNNDYEIYESQVIKPHSLLNFSHLKVIVLINENTLCASESFLDFMKTYYEKLTIIGSKKTKGAFSNVYMISFDDGNFCKINSLVKTYPASGYIHEEIGYSPDIWVTLDKVEDLAPYNDKILQTALDFLKQNNLVNKTE